MFHVSNPLSSSNQGKHSIQFQRWFHSVQCLKSLEMVLKEWEANECQDQQMLSLNYTLGW